MDLFRESLCLQLIDQLSEFVEIDTRPEPKGMRNRFRRGMTPVRGSLAQSGANCSIHRFLKGNAELVRPLFQQSRQIIVERQGRPHYRIIDASSFDVKTSKPVRVSKTRSPVHPRTRIG
jgi:hypothetical protein